MEFDETIARLTKGDATCLEAILTDLGPGVRALLRERFGKSLNEDDFDDAMSVALSRLWTNRERYDPKKSALSTWFYLLARNAAIDLLRKRPRFPAIPEPQLAHGDAVLDRPGRETMIARRRILAEFLSTLSETDRSILMAFSSADVEPNWAAAAAEDLQMPVSTVRVRKLRLLRALRERMERSGSHPK